MLQYPAHSAQTCAPVAAGRRHSLRCRGAVDVFSKFDDFDIFFTIDDIPVDNHLWIAEVIHIAIVIRK